MLASSTLTFLKNLKKNNDKPWFEGHRKQFEEAKQDFETFIGEVIRLHSRKDPGIGSLQPKDCIFRIYRDVRFAKDKSPYKTNFGASINRGGKKSHLAGYYFHCSPGESFSGGGLWMPMGPELKKIRQEIDYSFPEFNRIITSSRFKKVYGALYDGEDTRLTKVPHGFDKEGPAAEFLKLKSILAMKDLPDQILVSKDLVPRTLETFETLQPLLDFLNRAVED